LGSVIRMILPRARGNLLHVGRGVFSKMRSNGAMTITGICSSMRAIGPCLSSPAA